jgi:hypothetical protein
MALITDYTTLKTALADFQDRTDVPVDQAIQLAEARLNRLLKTVEIDADLTGTTNSRFIDVAALKVTRPISLFATDPNCPVELEPLPRAPGSYPYSTHTGFPSMWSISGTNLAFDCLLSQEYAFRFRYVGRFALSDAAPTNDLLTNNPDIYVCAAIVWGGLYVADDAIVARYGNPLDTFVREQKSVQEQNSRSVLTVDCNLTGQGRVLEW